ncbi:hypothetical protein C8R47DRAFT_1216028 [Mycena vitilis]|nr:hypothetical protein C8R47DRAFT_1216028 [Mycena vitilis]
MATFSVLLPPETVALIFEYCLPSHTWRAWSLLLYFPLKYVGDGARYVWILLVCGHPSPSVTLDDPSTLAFPHAESPARTEDDPRADVLMRIVKPYSCRWQEVHFALPASAHQQLDTFPCLERLTLVTPDAAGPSGLQDAPSLGLTS